MMPFYGSPDGFRTYHSARNRDVSQYTDDKINGALLLSSEWLDNRYRNSFPGWKVGMRAQVREWPRYSAFDVYGWSIPSDSIPPETENATYEAALRDLVAPGSLSVDWAPQQYRRATVEGAVSVEYNIFGSAFDVQTRFMVIDEILSGILTGSGNVSPLSGSACRG